MIYSIDWGVGDAASRAQWLTREAVGQDPRSCAAVPAATSLWMGRR